MACLAVVSVRCIMRLKSGRLWISFVFVITASSVLMVLWGVPMIHGGNRSITAFGQHFSLNWVRWENSSLSPWGDSRRVMSVVFGDASSILECVISNPKAMVKHILSNITVTHNFFYKV